MLTTQIIIVDQLLQLLPLLLVMPLVPLPLVLMMSHPSMIMMPPVGPAQTALAPAAGPHGSQLTLLGCGVVVHHCPRGERGGSQPSSKGAHPKKVHERNGCVPAGCQLCWGGNNCPGAQNKWLCWCHTWFGVGACGVSPPL